MKKAFINGIIYTSERLNPFAEVVIVNGNKIEHVGQRSDLTTEINSSREIIDLKNKLLLPGFTDSHLHLMYGAESLTQLNLSNVNSRNNFQNEVTNYLSKNKSFCWIMGFGWDENLFIEDGLPNLDWIDKITGEIPFYATRKDLHMALANSAALKLADINSSTTDPPGGIIEKNKNGELTGILKDTAMDLVKKFAKSNFDQNKETAFKNAVNLLHSFGITSVHDISNNGDYNFFNSLASDGKLKLRINSIPRLEDIDLHPELYEEAQFPELLRCKTVKAFADGSLGASTAWFFEEYLHNSGYFGLPTEIFQSGQIFDLVRFADEKGIQLAIHAIGNKANSEVISLCAFLSSKFGRRDRRFRIEHLQHIRISDIERARNEKIIASIQPFHLVSDADQISRRLPNDIINQTYPLKTILDSGITMVFGSDWTVVEPSVIKGIDAAVNRNTRSGKKHWLSSQRISVKNAVDAYTRFPAYASFEEKIKGNIACGKLADFTILSENIFNIPPDQISNVEIDSTYFDGELVYSK